MCVGVQAVGWAACEGRIYPGPTDTRWHARGAPFSPPVAAEGAVLGCGMDILSNTVFFTCDGAVIGTAHPAGRGAAAAPRSAYAPAPLLAASDRRTCSCFQTPQQPEPKLPRGVVHAA